MSKDRYTVFPPGNRVSPYVLENPRVSLVVDVWDEDRSRLAWVVVEGTAVVVGERARALDALVAKYAQSAAMDLAATAGGVLAITPALVLAWRAANG